MYKCYKKIHANRTYSQVYKRIVQFYKIFAYEEFKTIIKMTKESVIQNNKLWMTVREQGSHWSVRCPLISHLCVIITVIHMHQSYF